MSKVVVLGDMDAFRHIVAATLRASGVEAVEATIGGATVTCLLEEQPEVVIVHPPQGVFERAYLDQISQYTHGARVFVVRESTVTSFSEDGNVTYVSRVQVRELVEIVRRLAAPQPSRA